MSTIIFHFNNQLISHVINFNMAAQQNI